MLRLSCTNNPCMELFYDILWNHCDQETWWNTETKCSLKPLIGSGFSLFIVAISELSEFGRQNLCSIEFASQLYSGWNLHRQTDSRGLQWWKNGSLNDASLQSQVAENFSTLIRSSAGSKKTWNLKLRYMITIYKVSQLTYTFVKCDFLTKRRLREIMTSPLHHPPLTLAQPHARESKRIRVLMSSNSFTLLRSDFSTHLHVETWRVESPIIMYTSSTSLSTGAINQLHAFICLLSSDLNQRRAIYSLRHAKDIETTSANTDWDGVVHVRNSYTNAFNDTNLGASALLPSNLISWWHLSDCQTYKARTAIKK